MLYWIKKKLGLVSLQDPYIFHYMDGTTKRSADPIAIEESLRESLGKDWMGKIKDYYTPVNSALLGIQADESEKYKIQLKKDILNAIDRAFGVKRYDDYGGQKKADGLIDTMRLGLLDGYIRFCTDLMRLARPFGNA